MQEEHISDSRGKFREESSFSVLCSPSHDQHAKPRRKVFHNLITRNYLFNRLQTPGGMILIDARSHESFSLRHIISAINIPMPNLSTSMYEKSNSPGLTVEDVHNSIKDSFDQETFRRRKLVEIIIYGGNGNSWENQLRDLLVDEGLASAVKMLCGSFEQFYNGYPFMTESYKSEEILELRQMKRTDSGNHEVTYPNEILDGFLYMGNMWQAQQEMAVKQLQITHIINASLDCANRFACRSVKYLNISIKDKEDSDISSYFNECFDFIVAASHTPHGRVLVHCTQGVSRSAAIVIWYIMKSKEWTLVQAHNFVLQRRGVIFPNMGFMRQLRKCEIQMYGHSSVAEEEIDMLLQGGFQDLDLSYSHKEGKSCPCKIS